MSAPDWAPQPEQVAAYITSRTVDFVSTPGSDEPVRTFTTTTVPTAEQVYQLIADACSWVTMATGTIVDALEEQAASVAAMRTAALVEMTFPVRDGDIDSVAAPLLQESRLVRDDLAAANRAAGGTGPNTNGAPVYSFPDPDQWRDADPWRVVAYPHVL